MNTALGTQSWFGAVSVTNLGVALVVAVVIAIVTLALSAHPRLDHKARAITQRRSVAKPMEVFLRHPLQWLATQTAFVDLRRSAIDWISEHAILGETELLRLRQAGLRNRKTTIIYFESMRLVLAIAAAFIGHEVATGFGLLDRNPVLAYALILFAAVVSLFLPSLYLHWLAGRRRREFEMYWDDAIGLLIICLDAGLSIEVALRRIARELAPTTHVLAEELIITVSDLALLSERRQAYLNLSQRMDLPSVKSVVIALIQAEKQGASIAHSLRVISSSSRQERIAQAEEKAAALGPKMTVPMIIFFLPVVFVIIIAPIFLASEF
jgi:tight adherence protein C